MKKVLLLCVVWLGLFAQNPKVYSVLGDGVYDSVDKVKALKSVDGYVAFIPKIDRYLTEVAKAKELGYLVESGQKISQKTQYLKTLRKLSEENKYFTRSANSTFKSALESQNSDLFISIVNSGMVDTQKNSAKIINYYNKHTNEINPDGVIQNLMDEAYAKKHKKKYVKKTKSLTNKAKVKRIREADKAKEVALEKKLSDEVAQKKENIRQEQEKELFK
jgi:hypothetical protein